MKREKKYSIEDFEATGTLEQIASSLMKLAHEISTATKTAIDDNNDEEQPFYSDIHVSCTLFPMA